MSSRSIGLLLVVMVAVFLFGSPVSAQFTISGTATDTSGVPVSGVDVFLYRDNGNPIGIPPTITDLAGFYSITGLPVETYGVGFEPEKLTGLLATIITPVVVNSNTTVNVTLVRGNIVTGFVRDTLGIGLFNIDLNIYDQIPDTQIVTPGDNTDSTGFYRIVVADAIYTILWRPVSGENLIPVEIADIVIVNDTSIDVTMFTGVIVSGMVTGQLMVPVFNADFDFIDAMTGVTILTPGDNTDSSGFYSILVPPGTYDIRLDALKIDKLVPQQVLGVPVTADTTINYVMTPGFSLSGTVTDSNSIAVPDADLDVRFTATGAKLYTPGDNTDALGQYEIIVPAGMFDIFYKPPVASRLAPIVLDSVTVTSDLINNAVVPDGLLLSGLIRNTNLAVVPGVDIDARDVLTGTDVFLTGDNTDGSGIFSFVIVPGTYDLDIEPSKTRRLSAQKILDIPLVNDTSILVILDTGIVVAGVVQDSAGSVVQNVDVSAINGLTGDTVFTLGDKSNSFGQYEILVPPGTYDLSYVPDSLSPITDSILLTDVPIVNDTVIDVSFSSGLPNCCIASRGDLNGDSTDANILDLTFLVDFIFRNGPKTGCDNEGDANSDGIPSNIIDLTFLVDRIFRGGPAPGPC